MTILSPDTIDTTILIDNTTGLITPAGMRAVADSAAGIFAGSPITGSTTLTLAQRGTCVEINASGPATVSIPTNASVAFDVGVVIEVFQMGAGQVTIAAVTPGTTTILTDAGTFTIRAQNGTVSLRQRATDIWVLSGALT